MNIQKRWFPSLFIALIVGVMLLPPLAWAKESLSDSWIMTPKDGKSMEFEQAFKKHVARRAELNDPRSWRVYVPVLGDELDRYVIRSCCFGWQGFDEYRQWSEDKDPMTDWQKNVDKLVDKYEHYFSMMDMDNSKWADELTYKYVGVTHYTVKQGHWRAMEEDKKILSEAAKVQKWPYSWSWESSVGGASVLMLAVPYKSYAEMEPPETGFAKMLAMHLGSEDKAKQTLERWASHFESTHYALYEWREDLSM
ncbi:MULTISPECIES: hypothetical protein [Shewanella]|jgi:hypothetical protein|uniref:Uncharacterized protein n=2 Tax=Shewanella psychromarinicola TaxID=2487742 RepID=A0ABM7C1M4_9GAMM|nr:hypothetical protein [Shewanella psychromarinicola]AZG36286.1 hypothetical protein EGC80_16315 [Shewanella psychromarinicola]MCL1082200.1 hypothetical protein [Shewanella psychromarinicola]